MMLARYEQVPSDRVGSPGLSPIAFFRVLS